jgi:type IV secretion system protein VirB6
MTARGSNATINEMLFNMARIAIVFAFVENSAGLLDLAIGFIHELKTGFIGSTSLFAILDEQFIVTQKLTVRIIKIDDSMTGVMGMLTSLMVWCGTILVLATAAIVFIAAEVSLVLLTVTSPIFIGCLTYGFTRELFNGWLRSIFSCVITLIFATLVVKIGIDISKDMMQQLATTPAKNSLLTIGATSLVIGIIVSSLVLGATRMAGNIAGVAAMSAIQGGMILATRAGGYLGKASTNQYRAREAGNTVRSGNNEQGLGSSHRSRDDKILRAESQKVAFTRNQQTNLRD